VEPTYKPLSTSHNTLELTLLHKSEDESVSRVLCTCARPYRRVGRCALGRQGVRNGIRADPRGCAYGSVCEHRVHGAWA
jgi:hypothetical protein